LLALTRPAILILLLAGIILQAGHARAQPPVRLADAAEQGTFNVGNSQARLVREPGEPGQGPSLGIEYAIPPGAAAGLYAKRFPTGLEPGTADLVELSARVRPPEQAGAISAALELKGAKGTQRVPLAWDGATASAETQLDWTLLGPVNEVVLSLNRVGDGESARGTLQIDARFTRLDPLRRLSLEPWARWGGVLAASAAAALIVALLHLLAGRASSHLAEEQEVSIPPPETPWPWLLARDAVQGVGVVLIAVLVVVVYQLGSLGPLEIGWSPIIAAGAGVLVAEWWKRGLTGRHLTTTEAFLDALATGLPAASSSALGLLQAPSSPREFLLLSQAAAAASVLVYHASNGFSLSTRGRHLGAPAAALIVGAPYAVGMLTALQSSELLQALGTTLSAGGLARHPDAARFLGRVLILFGFNVLVAQGLSLSTTGRPLRSLIAHLMMLAVAAAAVAAPWIAAAGSAEIVSNWPATAQWVATVLTAMLAEAGLWAEAYLVTGLLLGAMRGQAPDGKAAVEHPVSGMKKAAVYSGVFLGGLHGLHLLFSLPPAQGLARAAPLLAAALLGALVAPLVKTVIETFDGSPPFFLRLRRNYASPVLPLRGAIAGLGIGCGLLLGLPDKELSVRAFYGFAVGALAYAGIDLAADAVRSWRQLGRVRTWRLYVSHALLGGFIGAAIGFYLDAAQVGVITAKYHRYLVISKPPSVFDIYPLVSKWGHLTLGTETGGVSLFFLESLAGVISWSTAAWLFAINRTFQRAYFWKDSAPIRTLFTAGGLKEVGENMIYVLRWGLWMSPIINSFLRPMGDPTWYNQDGAIRTTLAIARDATLSPDAFRAWSLQVFIYLLAYDSIRILIWLDHMGLRVATLVNLSFLGMDRLEQRLARWLAPDATSRCVPEAVKRFTTWVPLLIPYYIPRGAEWDRAWSASEALRAHDSGGVLGPLLAASAPEKAIWLLAAAAACTVLCSAARLVRARWGTHPPSSRSLQGPSYEVALREDGALVSRDLARDHDISRRSYDWLDPAGRALLLVECSAETGETLHHGQLLGNTARGRDESRRLSADGHSLLIRHTARDLQVTVRITLPGGDDPAELWTVEVENRADTARTVKLVPYLEWVLDSPEADRGHTQYKRLFTETEFVEGLHALIAFDRHSKRHGFLAADRRAEGFLTSRIDFIGRAGSLASPFAIGSLRFDAPRDTSSHATLDPIAGLLLGLTVPARGSARLRILVGFAGSREAAAETIVRCLELRPEEARLPEPRRAERHPIGHGAIPEGVSPPYVEFNGDGNSLNVLTPFTPRPFDHTLSNALGHVVSVTNRGLHTSASVNAQQNRLTPDWSDIVTRELPGEAFYLHDLDRHEWYAPTYQPLNDPEAACTAVFGLDGTATFRMTRGTIETELTVFVPPDDPTGVYLLTIRNHGDQARRFRLAPYFQVVLAGQPEYSGPLAVEPDPARHAVFFENPRNTYRTGPAFVAASVQPEVIVTRRGPFFGAGRDVARPYLLEHGRPDPDPRAADDDRPIGALLVELEIPPRDRRTVVVVLGQADDRSRAVALVDRYRDVPTALAALHGTREWWLGLMATLQVRTDQPGFDRYLDWLKYQALAERIWARRGFYQASGAYGFRDQLQDSVNLIWVDPGIARRQILLHAAQQFVEGDVVHWFHLLQDGRTGFVGRTHASDNLLWLAWATVEYVGQTGDESILDERAAYLESEQPFPPLPAGKGGMGFDPIRSPLEETLYRHVLRAIDLVLDHRMGAHALPLMGTGDWNDGLDEIGSEGRGESVWLALFLAYILERMVPIVAARDDEVRREYYARRLAQLHQAIEGTWRGDRYLRAIHDDGTEIGVRGSGVWEIDALTAAWAVLAGVDPHRGETVFHTALSILEQDRTILLGWPPLREDTHPYLGRSSVYPEGVRENGMYCHGVQWLIAAARALGERAEREGRLDDARGYFDTTYRLWRKIAPLDHAEGPEIETYGGQPNKQAADLITTFDPGRMIWNGYTGAAGWMLRQALEGVLGFRLVRGELVAPRGDALPAAFHRVEAERDPGRSPLPRPGSAVYQARRCEVHQPLPAHEREPS
jgi:cyclic beta-1,2-glucan synthetase